MPCHNLSCPQHTEEGRFLGYLYYQTRVLDMFTRDERGGYPHNGGTHTLYLYVSHADLGAFLDLVMETFSMSPRWAYGAALFVRNAQRINQEQVVA